MENFQSAVAHIHFARAIVLREVEICPATQEVAKLGEIERKLDIPAGGYDWKTQVAIGRQVAAAWLARAEGRNDEALRVMRGAADADDALEKHPVTPGAILPAREQLGELLLELGRPAEALSEFEASLEECPTTFSRNIWGRASGQTCKRTMPKRALITAN